MSTWKKVLTKGLDITGGDVEGNHGDLVAGAGITMSGTLQNTLLGAEGEDVTVGLDISGLTHLDATPADGDFVVVQDISENGAGVSQLKKVEIADLAASFSSDVTSVQLTGDSSNTGTLDGAANITIAGGVGITTTGSAGQISIAGDDAVAEASGTDANKGIASFNDSHFTAVSGFVSLADDSIDSDQIVDGSVDAVHLAGSIGDDKLSELTTADKVNITALNIDGASYDNSTLQTGDVFPVVDVNGGAGSAAINGKTTIDAINTYVGSNAASFATVHSGITGESNITGSGIQFVSAMTFADHGHVTGATLTDLPAATTGTAGILNDGSDAQAITGEKTFEDNITMSSNLTVSGNLQVDGTTTTVNSTEVNIADTQIVLGVPDTAYDIDAGGVSSANSAADNNGIVVASHHASTGFDDADTDAQIIAKYAGVRWRTGGELTGWVVNDTAAPHAPGEGVAYDADQETEGAQFAIAIMDFMTAAGTPPSAPSAGVGSFMMNTTDEELYIRVA